MNDFSHISSVLWWFSWKRETVSFLKRSATLPHAHVDARRLSTCFDRLLARGAGAYDLHQVPSARAEEISTLGAAEVVRCGGHNVSLNNEDLL